MSAVEKQRVIAAEFPILFGLPPVTHFDESEIEVSVKSPKRASQQKVQSKTRNESKTGSGSGRNALLKELLGEESSLTKSNNASVSRDPDSAIRIANAQEKLKSFLNMLEVGFPADKHASNLQLEDEEVEDRPRKRRINGKNFSATNLDAFLNSPDLGTGIGNFVTDTQKPKLVKSRPKTRVSTSPKRTQPNVDTDAVVRTLLKSAPDHITPLSNDENTAESVSKKFIPDLPKTTRPVKTLAEINLDEAVAIATGDPAVKITAKADEIEEANRQEAERIREMIRARKEAKKLEKSANQSILFKKPKDIAVDLDIDISSLQDEINQRLNSGQRRRENTFSSHHKR